MEPELRNTLRDVLDALERLLRLFQLERTIHLIVGIIGFLMLLYAAVMLLTPSNLKTNTTLLVSLFGSSGLITLSSARITYFFNRAFRLVERIIEGLVGVKSAENINEPDK